MKTVALPAGERVPAFGLGTWQLGEGRDRDAQLATLRMGLELGATLIDTAEMYGEGGAEEVVGAAIADRRDEVFIVSKVYPHNATRRGAIAACERSLQRLKTDRIDFYQLHNPRVETIRNDEVFDTLRKLREEGKILTFGVALGPAIDRRQIAEGVAALRECGAHVQIIYHTIVGRV